MKVSKGSRGEPAPADRFGEDRKRLKSDAHGVRTVAQLLGLGNHDKAIEHLEGVIESLQGTLSGLRSGLRAGQPMASNTCAYPTGCTRKRLPGLTMCRRHQPYPAR